MAADTRRVHSPRYRVLSRVIESVSPPREREREENLLEEGKKEKERSGEDSYQSSTERGNVFEVA